MAKVLLIHQRPRPGMGTVLDSIFKRPPNLGLAYIKSSLKYAGHKADIVCVSTRKEAEKIAGQHSDCDLVGISGLTYTARGMRETASVFSSKGIPVAVGGVHATVFPESVMGFADYVVVGEGERHILRILDLLESKNDKPHHKLLGAKKASDGRLVPDPQSRIKDLDTLPPPELDDARQRLHPLIDRVFWPNVPFGVQIATSRGCPFNCSFCHVPLMQGDAIRAHSAPYLGSLLQRYSDGGARNFMFVDDNFTADALRVRKICKEIMERGLDITWFCLSRVDWIVKNRNLVHEMAKAGCIVVYYGVESASQVILDSYGKRITPQQVREATKILRQAGISPMASVILGAERDDMGTMGETLSLLKDIRPDYAQISVLEPLADFKEDLADRYTSDCINWKHPTLSSEQIETLQARANVDFYTDRENVGSMARNSGFKLVPPLSWLGGPAKRCAVRWFARTWARYYEGRLREPGH